MNKVHPEYIVDNKNNKRAVILPFDEWKAILEDLEELEDIRAYDTAKNTEQESIPFEEAVRDIYK